MESIGVSLAAVSLLLLANAFFVAAEFALVKAKGSRLELTVGKGSAAAALTVQMQAKIEPYLAACQLGITMASLGLGWIGEPAVAALLEPVLSLWSLTEETIHQIAFVVGFLAFSSLHIVIGEQVPKSLAIRQAEPVSMISAYPLQLFYLIAFPLTWLLDRASRGVLNLLKVAEGTHAEVLTLNELKSVVSISQEHGEIPIERAQMLRNLIELDDRPVGWVAIPRNRVTTLSLDATPEENLAILLESSYSRFPLLESSDSENVIGVVLTKDLTRAHLRGRTEPWSDLRRFAREPLVIPERLTVSRAFEILRAEREHLAIVADEYGELVGIVTLEDLIEEVVGEILDESDSAELPSAITEVGDGRWIVDGELSLADAPRELGLTVDFALEANTLSGLIIEKLARIPKAGESVVLAGFKLTVRRADERLVSEVLVERMKEP